ncbi:MAG: flippase-like domain-containing protein [Methylococcaceae bacterium]|nr:flippase-like domain-containing protein [Methylococcaceae bacterium]MCI0668755.1 flippase-like domain-containing protein [Methylococcaceae bacterium]MCI0732987.1 flippase-like domain-containing protein [Methylococcaceae bacterium]
MMKKVFSLIIVAGIMALALIYALWDVNFKELGDLLKGGDYRTLVPILCCVFLFFWLKAVRWIVILRPLGHFKVAQVTPPMMIGFAGSNVLPGHLGELIRTGIFSHRFSCTVSGTFVTIIVERIFDIVAIFALYEAGIAIIDSAPESLKIGAWFIAPLLAGLLAGILLMLWKPGIVLGLWGFFGCWFPSAFQEKVHGIINNVITAFSSLKSLASVFVLVVLSFLKWILMAGIIWFSLYAYGQFISLQLTFVLLGVLTLATTVPNAPGFIGAIQAAFVFALKPFGISEEIAFASSVLFLGSQWVPVTAIGAVYFISGGLHLSDVRKEIEEVEEASLL